MLIENMSMALSAIRANKMRSFLTMLGIIIGIGSVISIVSIGDTMRSFFSDLYSKIGVTQAYISSDYGLEDFRDSDYFVLDEYERVKEIFSDEIAYVDQAAGTDVDIHYGRKKMKFQFTGIDYNFQDVQPVEMLYGRYLNEGDIQSRKKNVVMEDVSAKSLFGTENAVGKTFRTTVYGDVGEYTVVGIYKRDLNAFEALLLGAGGGNGSAYIPYTLLAMPNSYHPYMRVYAAANIDLDNFYQCLVAYLAKSKGRNPEDYNIFRAQQEMQSVDRIMGTLSLAVGGIAAISLLVGGIGIMNIMLVSVTERTREIGIRKSLGAKTKDVMVQFLTESAILSACGGIIGVLAGTGIIVLAGTLLGVDAVVKLPVVLLAVGFSGAVGFFFGLYPASKAAKKDPIEALRYE